jgi:hypothetical protein
MPASELEQLREQIREAFQPSRFYGSVTTCDCQECVDLRTALSSKRWDELPIPFLDHTCSPTLLTAEAFQAFVPAYMLRALDHLTGERAVLEFTVYSLCPADQETDGGHATQYKDHYLKERAALMMPAQVEAIRSFLLFVAAHAKDRECLQSFVYPALENIWRYDH